MRGPTTAAFGFVLERASLSAASRDSRRGRGRYADTVYWYGIAARTLVYGAVGPIVSTYWDPGQNPSMNSVPDSCAPTDPVGVMVIGMVTIDPGLTKSGFGVWPFVSASTVSVTGDVTVASNASVVAAVVVVSVAAGSPLVGYGPSSSRN